MKWTVAKRQGQWWAHSPGCPHLGGIICVLFNECVNVKEWHKALAYASYRAAEKPTQAIYRAMPREEA